MPNFPTKCGVEWVDAEDPLFLLYTSGSTGKPKVVLTLNLVDCSSTPLTKLSTYYEPYRVCCIQLGAIWSTLLQHLSMHLTTSPEMYTGNISLLGLWAEQTFL